ncbi:MAG: c-type cytochrome [Arenicellales bacterium]
MNKSFPLLISRFGRTVTILTLFAVMVPNTLADGRGAQIYESQCASCHGNEGLALNAPVLHGQEPAYIVRSLMAFKHGSRIDQIMMSMNSIAADLKDEDISVVARYLAGQDPCEIDLKIDYGREGFREAFSAGRKQYAASNCGHCHESFHHYAPRIMGQKASYLKLALSQFQSGIRVAPMMSRLLQSWTEQDFQNVVTYISGMRLMRACGSDH